MYSLRVYASSADPPSLEIALMLRDPIMSLSVTFIEGSALIDKDLQRAHVDSALAIFIMANKFSVHADEEDAKTILQQLSIKRYVATCMSNQGPSLVAGNALANAIIANTQLAVSATPSQAMLYCLQLIRPENQRHLATNASETTDENVVVVCFNEIRMGVLAKAIMFPGT
jgi:hypothetical protein